MKTRILICLSVITLASCSKEETPHINTSQVQFRVSINGQEVYKLPPALHITGDISGIAFDKLEQGNECSTEPITLNTGKTVTFNILAESNAAGTFHIDVLVDGKIMASFGASCPSNSYDRKMERLPL